MLTVAITSPSHVREHSKSWGADGIGLGFGLTGRGWAGAEAGVAGKSDRVRESAVKEIVAKRMNKKQQMRWNRTTVQPFPDMRTAILNDTIENAFRHRYPASGPPTMTRGCQQKPD